MIAYDPETHHLDVTLPAGATAEIVAEGGLTIRGDVYVHGKLEVSKDIWAGEEVTAAGVKLTKHKHKGVQVGTAQSGEPV